MKSAPAPPSRRILALHGFWGSPSDFDDLRRSLQIGIPISWRIPPLPGHGGEPLPDRGASIEALADWCAETIRRSDLREGCTLLGYSMGARIALATAVRYPGHINGLVLISGSPGLSDPAERAARAKQDAERAEKLASCQTREMLEVFLREWWAQPVFRSPAWGPGIFDKQLPGRLGEDPLQLAAVLKQASPGLQEALGKKLAGLEVPVLCIAGEADEKFCNYAREMSLSSRFWKAKILPGAGHSLLLENPPDLTDCIIRWMLGHSGGESPSHSRP